MVWWEAVLSPALQVLLDKLASGEILEFLRKWDISAELIEKLKIAYFSNTLVLDDAEEKQHSNPAVEAWLDMLKDAAFEAEDVLDELATAAIRWKLDVSLPNQVRTWNFISNFNPFNEKIESRIQKIIDKLEYVAKQKEFLGLEADIGQRNSCVNLTTSLLIDSHVYGRDKDLDNVIQLLLDSKEASKEGFVQQVVDESKTLEEVGQEYFDNLLSRSFFQESPFDNSRSGLQEMPMDIGRLISLQRLPEFIVGNHRSTGINELRNLQMGSGRSSGIDELRDLQQVQGTLTISKLENVINAWDAKRANLTDKRNLDELVLEWSSNSDGLQNERIQLDILEMSQPHQKLKRKLVIHEAERLKPPLPLTATLSELYLKKSDAMLFTTAPNLTRISHLQIYDIVKLTHIPDRILQQLTELKNLDIIDCCDLSSLWKNESNLVLQTSLQRLVIRNCPVLVTMLEEEEQLPIKLEHLEVECCHNLERLPTGMENLTSLRELIIKDCQKLVISPDANFTSMLRGLAVQGCGFGSLPEWLVHNLNSPLESIYISGCYNFTSFSTKCDHLPTTFQQLTINNCPSLESLPKGLMHVNNLTLKVLEIFDCFSLSSFPTGQLPGTLKTLTIWNCTNLESLADVEVQENMSLESFRVGYCSSLKCLPNDLWKLMYLDYLEIDGCPGLESFPEGGFPTNSLKKVYISNCDSLKCLPDGMQNLTSLQELHLSECPSFKSLPEGGFPINLISLEIKDCENICPLSEWDLHRLNSLEKLSITGGCSELSSFPEWLLPSSLTCLHIGRLALPVDGLPNTLSRLEICDCPTLEQQCEKDLPKIDHIPCTLM
ncbi:Disease resistance protein RGA2 [Euphorbia peplus]|nr:Disease resistance protein RGA2 [Euphorbia peplus]